jgi:hypothetical protein
MTLDPTQYLLRDASAGSSRDRSSPFADEDAVWRFPPSFGEGLGLARKMHLAGVAERFGSGRRASFRHGDQVAGSMD